MPILVVTIDDQRVMIVNKGVHDAMIDCESMIRSGGELPLGECRRGTDSDYLPACCISPPPTSTTPTVTTAV